MKLASTQEGRNRKLFKAGKVSIITDTLPVFAYYAGFIGISLPFHQFYVIWAEKCDRGNLESLPFRRVYVIWVEIYDRRYLESLPFRQISAIWVEKFDRRLQESLPFSAGFRCLGRDLRPAELGISTFFGRFTSFR